MNSGKVFVGILTSLAAGITIGILFAPDKGTSTRKKISATSDKFSHELEGKFSALITSMNEKFEKIGRDLTLVAKKGAEKSEQIAKEAAANGINL